MTTDRHTWQHPALAALGLLLIASVAATTTYHLRKPLPTGLNFDSGPLPVTEVRYLADRTWIDADGEQQLTHSIFDEILDLIAAAEELLVLDLFLFNDFAGGDATPHRALSRELTDAVLQRRRERPDLKIVFITDPFNTFYGSLESKYLRSLEDAGIRVILTDLDALRDPNPAWSGLWRLCCRRLGNHSGGGWLPSPVGGEPVTLRSYLRVLNFKANHRKAVVARTSAGWEGLVTSANPHDASSRHDNVALRFSGPAALALLASEEAVAAFSGADAAIEAPPWMAETPDGGDAMRILTESRIRDAAQALLDGASPGDQVDIAMFYFSHRGLVQAVLAAHRRGVQVRVLLDPNRDAFGREKDGVPNRQVAGELHRAGVPLRWCATRGQQCHGKLLQRRSGERSELLLGSANFTRRNLDNYNLETNVLFSSAADHPAALAAAEDFEQRWHNRDDRHFSEPYAAFADPSRLRYWRYRFMEATGMSSF